MKRIALIIAVLCLLCFGGQAWAIGTLNTDYSASTEQGYPINRYGTADNTASKFVPNSGATLYSITLKFKANSATPIPSNVTLKIFSHDAAENDPDAILAGPDTDATSDSVDISTIPGLNATTYVSYTFTGLTVPVVSGTTYWRVLYADAVNSTHYVIVRGTASANWGSDMELRSDDDGSGTWTVAGTARCFDAVDTGSLAVSGAVDDPYTSIAQLNMGIDTEDCGRTVYLQSGTYTSGTIQMDKTCTAVSPFTVSASDGAAEALGGVTLTQTAEVEITGQYMKLRGFWLNDSTVIPVEISSGGSYNIIEECLFEDIINAGGGFGIGLATNDCTYNTLQRSTFIHTDTGTWGGYMARVRQNVPLGIRNTHNSIVECAFIGHHTGGNTEDIQVGEGDYEPLEDTWTLIANNLFWDSNNSAELISIKTNRTVIYGNTVIGGLGAITLRVGDWSQVISNIMYYPEQPISGSDARGIRISGGHHLVANNYLGGEATSFGIYAHYGAVNPNVIDRAHDCVIEHNVVKDPDSTAFTYSWDDDRFAIPTNNVWRNNYAERSTWGWGLFGYEGAAPDEYHARDTWENNYGYITAGYFTNDLGVATNIGTTQYTVKDERGGVSQWFPATPIMGNSKTLTPGDLYSIQRNRPSLVGPYENLGGASVWSVPVGVSWDGRNYTISNAPYKYRTTVTGATPYAGWQVNCSGVSGMSGVSIPPSGSGATLYNFTVGNCLGDGIVAEADAFLTNVISTATGADLSVAAGKKVIGRTNVFSDAALAGSFYVDVPVGALTTQWNADPLINTNDFYLRIRHGSPAAGKGTNVCSDIPDLHDVLGNAVCIGGVPVQLWSDGIDIGAAALEGGRALLGN